MPSKDHIHTYRRVKTQPNRYMCADPTCSHSQIKEMLNGKESLCWACGNKFVLDSQHLKRAKPHCGCLTGAAKSESIVTPSTFSIEETLLKKLGGEE